MFLANTIQLLRKTGYHINHDNKVQKSMLGEHYSPTNLSKDELAYWKSESYNKMEGCIREPMATEVLALPSGPIPGCLLAQQLALCLLLDYRIHPLLLGGPNGLSVGQPSPSAWPSARSSSPPSWTSRAHLLFYHIELINH